MVIHLKYIMNIDMKKKRIILVATPLIIVCFLLGYLVLTRMTVKAGIVDLEIYLEKDVLLDPAVLEPGLVYPPTITTNKQKLAAVYSLLEQMRQEHNRIGESAKSDWEKYKNNWYNLTLRPKHLGGNPFWEKMDLLLKEQNRLKTAIRSSNYNDEQWDKLSENQQIVAMLGMYGNKEILKENPTFATSRLLEETKAMTIDFTGDVPPDPFEDFSSYDEVDEESDITITGTDNITVVSMDKDVDSYVRDSKGANHFGDFEHLITVSMSSFGGTGYVSFWATDNGSATEANRDSNNEGMNVYSYGSNEWLLIKDWTNDETDYDLSTDEETYYYLTIERADTTLTCKIYTDEERTVLDDTLSITCGTGAYEYVYGCSSKGDVSGGSVASASILNLDLQEAEESPDVYVSPSSRDLGIVLPNSTYWTNTANSTAPSWPLTDGDAYFTVTNNGSISIDVTIKGTNFTGGSSSNWTLVQTSPSTNEARWMAWQESDNLTDNITLTTSEQNFITSLGASNTIDIELRLETGGFDLTEGGGAKTSTITLTAGAS